MKYIKIKYTCCLSNLAVHEIPIFKKELRKYLIENNIFRCVVQYISCVERIDNKIFWFCFKIQTETGFIELDFLPSGKIIYLPF